MECRFNVGKLSPLAFIFMMPSFEISGAATCCLQETCWEGHSAICLCKDLHVHFAFLDEFRQGLLVRLQPRCVIGVRNFHSMFLFVILARPSEFQAPRPPHPSRRRPTTSLAYASHTAFFLEGCSGTSSMAQEGIV